MKGVQQKEFDECVHRTVELFLDSLLEKWWCHTVDLEKRIPDELALEAFWLTDPEGCLAVEDRQAQGRKVLAKAAVKILKKDWKCQMRGCSADEEIHLPGSSEDDTVPAAPEEAAATARPGNAQPAGGATRLPTGQPVSLEKPAPHSPGQGQTTPAGTAARPGEGSADPAGAHQPLPEVAADRAAGREVRHPDLQVVWLPVQELRLHPLAQKIPRMRDQEREGLRADICRHGVREPIKVQQGGIVLDGRHRLEDAAAAGATHIPALVVDLSPDDQADEVYRAALLRRHLSDDQRAMLAQRWADLQSSRSKQTRARKGGQAGGRSRKKAAPDSSVSPGGAELSGEPPPPRTPRAREQAARAFNVSIKKVARAAAVDKEAPELGDKVQAGELKLAAASKEVQARKAAAETSGSDGSPASPSPVPLVRWQQSGQTAHVTLSLPPDVPQLAEVLCAKLGWKVAVQLHEALGARLSKGRKKTPAADGAATHAAPAESRSIIEAGPGAHA
jgi:hypothetical protein